MDIFPLYRVDQLVEDVSLRIMLMNELDKLALREAKNLVSQMNGVQVLDDWSPVSDFVAVLPIQLELVGVSATEPMPKYTNWNVCIDFAKDTWGKVQIFPSLDNGIKTTFEHQQFNGRTHPNIPVRSGNICSLTAIHGLAISRNALSSEPKSTIERICWHVGRALDWVKAAADGTLSQKGDPFEMPDFDTGAYTPKILSYNEDNSSFQKWNAVQDRYGIVKISKINDVFILRDFQDKKGLVSLFAPAWGLNITGLSDNHKAVWLRLFDMPVIKNWQVPYTFSELHEALNNQGIDLKAILREVLKNFNYPGECFLFMGIPIPRVIGEEASRYHWQALKIGPAVNKLIGRAQLIISHSQTHSKIPWFQRCENWNGEDLLNRGAISVPLKKKKLVIVGCGAFGSCIAEQLVRMGCNELVLVDGDLLEPGNLVRHVLDINDIYKYKAIALAERLNRINPGANVKGFSESLPSENKDLLLSIMDADLIIDATANDEVLNLINSLKAKEDCIFITSSIGLHAKKLFLYSCRIDGFDVGAFIKWFEPYRVEQHKLAEEEKLPRGVGCWHPLVPAPLNRLLVLAGISVELIEQIVNEKSTLPVSVCHTLDLPIKS